METRRRSRQKKRSADRQRGWKRKREQARHRAKPRHVTSSYELPLPASPSLASKTSRAEFSCRQTGRFTSAVPQLPVTLTVVGFKSGLALELPGYTWRRAIKRRRNTGLGMSSYLSGHGLPPKLHLSVYCATTAGAHTPPAYLSVCPPVCMSVWLWSNKAKLSQQFHQLKLLYAARPPCPPCTQAHFKISGRWFADSDG